MKGIKGPAQRVPCLCSCLSVCTTNVFMVILLVRFFSYSFCCSETNVLPSVLSSGRCAEAQTNTAHQDRARQSEQDESGGAP